MNPGPQLIRVIRIITNIKVIMVINLTSFSAALRAASKLVPAGSWWLCCQGGPSAPSIRVIRVITIILVIKVRGCRVRSFLAHCGAPLDGVGVP